MMDLKQKERNKKRYSPLSCKYDGWFMYTGLTFFFFLTFHKISHENVQLHKYSFITNSFINKGISYFSLLPFCNNLREQHRLVATKKSLLPSKMVLTEIWNLIEKWTRNYRIFFRFSPYCVQSYIKIENDIAFICIFFALTYCRIL